REIGRDPGARPWTAGALECLLLFPWEENLRQLLGEVRHAATQTAEFPCSPAHLQKPLREHRNQLRVPAGPPHDEPTPQQPTPADPPPRTVDPTRDEIIEALRQTAGRVRPAAQLLGVDRRKLYRL